MKISKNKKLLLLAITLATVLIITSAVNATNTTDHNTHNTISEKTSTPATSEIKETTIKEKITSKNTKTEEKTINKTDKTEKEKKTTTTTITVNDYQELLSTSTIIDADTENDNYVINLNEGTYKITTKNNYFTVQKDITIKIEGNNQDLIASATNRQLYYNTTENTTLNNVKLHHQIINNGNLIINASTISNLTGFKNNNNLLINNSILTNFTGIGFTNNGETTINNCTINCKINNTGTLTITNCTYGEDYFYDGTGTLITDSEDESNKEITNENITKDMIISTNQNIIFTQCNISAKITNQGNIKLINCSLSNNNMTTAGSNTNGFLVLNNGNASLINCSMENNTFNATVSYVGAYANLYGAMVNKGVMCINGCLFDNNRVGYVEVYDSLLHAGYYGWGAVVTNNGTLFVDNSTFQNGYAGVAGGAINNGGNLTITGSYFLDNTVNTVGSAIFNSRDGRCDVYGSEFSGNYVNLNYNSAGGTIVLSGGGAIGDYDQNSCNHSITNCTFRDNRGEYTGDVSLYGISGKGGALLLIGHYTIQNSTFINNNITYGGIYGYGRSSTTTGCVLENSSITASSGQVITDNVFRNNSGISIDIDSAVGSNSMNITITGNNFTDNNLTTYYDGLSMAPNTITLIHSSTDTTKEETLNRLNMTITANQYTNTSLHDQITLNIPDKVYTSTPVTITGTYNLLEPENYDSDILEQNQFNVYVNDELYQTVDTLEFTITPTTTEYMIITVQPTISQTRKSASVTPVMLNFTLEDVTATVGETTVLTATITSSEETEINDGRVYFKVNGKILRDTTNGRILYADVSENTATLEYNVPKSWDEDTTIEAVFAGNDELPQVTSNTVTPTIATPEAQETEFTVEDVTTSAGSEVTITVTTKNLNSGKVVLKVNGKTVKATDGKLYAKTSGDTTSFTYTVPKTLKAGDYSIKAVYTSGATKLEADAKLVVV